MFKVNNKENQNYVTDVILVSLLLILSIFHTFFSVCIVNFEKVNVCSVGKYLFKVNYKDTRAMFIDLLLTLNRNFSSDFLMLALINLFL